jgi:hypothetical protein
VAVNVAKGVLIASNLNGAEKCDWDRAAGCCQWGAVAAPTD